MELSFTEMRELLGQRTHSLVTGTSVFVRTVTYHYTGRIVAITDSDIVLEDAAWVADSGRFANALATGTLNEVEPYPDRVIIARGGIVDCCEWKHPLPRKTK